jgi:hypothetical protein
MGFRKSSSSLPQLYHGTNLGLLHSIGSLGDSSIFLRFATRGARVVGTVPLSQTRGLSPRFLVRSPRKGSFDLVHESHPRLTDSERLQTFVSSTWSRGRERDAGFPGQ